VVHFAVYLCLWFCLLFNNTKHQTKQKGSVFDRVNMSKMGSFFEGTVLTSLWNAVDTDADGYLRDSEVDILLHKMVSMFLVKTGVLSDGDISTAITKPYVGMSCRVGRQRQRAPCYSHCVWCSHSDNAAKFGTQDAFRCGWAIVLSRI